MVPGKSSGAKTPAFDRPDDVHGPVGHVPASGRVASLDGLRAVSIILVLSRPSQWNSRIYPAEAWNRRLCSSWRDRIFRDLRFPDHTVDAQ